MIQGIYPLSRRKMPTVNQQKIINFIDTHFVTFKKDKISCLLIEKVTFADSRPHCSKCNRQYSLYFNPNIELDIPVTVCVQNFASKHYSEFIVNLFCYASAYEDRCARVLDFPFEIYFDSFWDNRIFTTVSLNRNIQKPDII